MRYLQTLPAMRLLLWAVQAIIGSLLAQGLSPLDAAKAGVFIHGRCADEAVKELSFRGLTVFDLTDRLGALMSEYE